MLLAVRLKWKPEPVFISTVRSIATRAVTRWLLESVADRKRVNTYSYGSAELDVAGVSAPSAVYICRNTPVYAKRFELMQMLKAGAAPPPPPPPQEAKYDADARPRLRRAMRLYENKQALLLAESTWLSAVQAH